MNRPARFAIRSLFLFATVSLFCLTAPNSAKSQVWVESFDNLNVPPVAIEQVYAQASAQRMELAILANYTSAGYSLANTSVVAKWDSGEITLKTDASGTAKLALTQEMLTSVKFSVPAGAEVTFATQPAIKMTDPSAGSQGGSRGQGASGPEPGDKAPEWAFKDSDGKLVEMSQYTGKFVLLDFWASWCKPCRLAMPGIDELHKKYSAKGLVVLSVNTMERSIPAAKTYLAQNGFTFKSVWDDGSSTAERYGIRGIPAVFLIGPSGRVVHKETGYRSDGQLERLVQAVMGL